MSLDFGSIGREWFEWALSLDRDSSGSETLVGLTRPESEEYLRLSELSVKRHYYGTRDSYEVERADSDRYLALYEVHECARLKRMSETFADRLQAHLAQTCGPGLH